MAKHAKHDPVDLSDALEHVLYEMWKYKQSVAYYRQIQGAGGDAAIEFRVLHHRVLLEFFYGPAKHQDNIVAWEYIDDWQNNHHPTNVPWLNCYMTRCHTMLAHVSTTRSQMAKSGLKAWARDWQTVEPHLEQIIATFLSGLSDEYKGTCFNWIDKWLKENHPGNDVLTDLAAIVCH